MKKEIVYTDKYALILSDDEIKKGDYFLTDDGRIEIDALDWNAREWHKKIIAHLPLSDAPILESVTLLAKLPPLSKRENVDVLAKEYADNSATCNYEEGINVGKYQGYIEGYNKAKEKYKYTEEDVRRAIEMGTEIKGDGMDDMFFTDDEIIERLQQPSRPTHFECDMMCGRCRSIDDECWSAKECTRGYDYPDIIRTITNSQGQVELVGKYI